MSAAASARTPWGDAEGLRGRRLWPRSGASAEEVARNQRERLMAAMAYIALAPFLGVEEACEVANGGGGVRSQAR